MWRISRQPLVSKDAVIHLCTYGPVVFSRAVLDFDLWAVKRRACAANVTQGPRWFPDSTSARGTITWTQPTHRHKGPCTNTPAGCCYNHRRLLRCRGECKFSTQIVCGFCFYALKLQASTDS